MIRHCILKSVFGTCFLLLSLCGLAGIEPVSYYQRLYAMTTTPNSFALAENKYLDPAYVYTGANPNAVVKSSVAKISLRFFDTTLVVPATQSYTYTFKIVAYNHAGAALPGSPFIKALSISRAPGALEKDIDLFAIPGAHKIEVQLVGNAAPYTPLTGSAFTSVDKNIAFEMQIETERYYLFNANTALSVSGGNAQVSYVLPAGEDLQVFWDHLEGAEEYDLEWTYVDDYGTTYGTQLASGPLNAKIITFKGNSTRVTVKGNSYKIPLVYERGFVVFRVRGVGRALSNTNTVLEGKWSVADNQSLGYFRTSTLCAFQVQQSVVHEADKKNWQYNATYAEDGKRKHTVTYADGTLRMRQIITQNNSDRTVIVGESIYDYQGRKAVEPMPVPDPKGLNTFRYYQKFTVNGAGAPYTKTDFDEGTCSVATPSLGATNGAGLYYSHANTVNPTGQGSFRAYTPNAFGYGFVQTEYTPDQTGRVRTQGGVGDNHYIGSGHETKTYYGSPDQEELDALFGTDVGYYTHYKKNVTVDANGQASIAYLDMKDKVIATALSGDAPASQTELVSQAPVAVNATYINNLAPGSAGAINGNSIDNNALVFNKKIVIESTTSYTINYNVQPEEYTVDCAFGEDLCYDCMYNLNISLKNDCGQDMLPATSNLNGGYTLPTTTGHSALVGQFQKTGSAPTFSFVAFEDNGCSNSSAANTYSPAPIVVSLPPGTYMLSKVLSINNDAMQFYLNAYLGSDCIKKLSDFETEANNAIDTTGCNIPCLECLESISVCEANYQGLLSDVSPGGQYAEYSIENGLVVAGGATSLLNPLNSLPCISHVTQSLDAATYGHYKPDWRHPILNGAASDYRYANGIVAYMPVDPGTAYYLANPSLVHYGAIDPATGYIDGAIAGNIACAKIKELENETAFRNAWNPAFARYLVEYHPEFAYYQFCITQAGKSEHYYPKKLQEGSAALTQLATDFRTDWRSARQFNYKGYAAYNPASATNSVVVAQRAISSEEFDEQLRVFCTSVSSMQNFVQFISGAGTAIASSTSAVGSLDLINIDPLFDMSGTNPLIAHNVFGSNSCEKLTYFKNKLAKILEFGPTLAASGITVSNVKEAFMQSDANPPCNCAFVFYPAPSSNCNGAYGSSSCASNPMTDAVWNHYRDFYLANKQQILFEMGDEFAKVSDYASNNFINNGSGINTSGPDYFEQLVQSPYTPGNSGNYRLIKGYNGCVGNSSFNAFESDFMRFGAFYPFGTNFQPANVPNTSCPVSVPNIIYQYPPLHAQLMGNAFNYYDNFWMSAFNYSFPGISMPGMGIAQGWGYWDRGQACAAGSAANYQSKVRRFQSGLAYAQQTYGTSATDAASLSAVLGPIVGNQNQQLGGNCNVAEDLRNLLDGLAKNYGSIASNGLQSAYVPLWVMPHLTKGLYDKLATYDGSSCNTYQFLQYQSGALGNVLGVALGASNTNAGYSGSTVFGALPLACSQCTANGGQLITLTKGSGYLFSQITAVKKIFNVAAISGGGSSFKLTVEYLTGTGTATDVISGNSCIDLSDCANSEASLAQQCAVTAFGSDLMKLMNALGAATEISTTPTYGVPDLLKTGSTDVNLNNAVVASSGPVNYAPLFSNTILSLLGSNAASQNWYWTSNASHNGFSIHCNGCGNPSINISLNSGIPYSAGTNYQFSNLHYDASVPGVKVDITQTDLTTYASTTNSYNISSLLSSPASNIALVDCHAPVNPLCNTTANQTYDQFQVFLNAITSNTLYTVNPYNSLANEYTLNNLLKSQLPGGVNAFYYLRKPYYNGVTHQIHYTLYYLNGMDSCMPNYFPPGKIPTKCLIQACDIAFTVSDPGTFAMYYDEFGDGIFKYAFGASINSLMPGTSGQSAFTGQLQLNLKDGTLAVAFNGTSCFHLESCVDCGDETVLSPSACQSQYTKLVVELNKLANPNQVTTSSSPVYVSQTEFCNQQLYQVSAAYLQMYQKLTTLISSLNTALTAASLTPVPNPLTDLSSGYFYSLQQFALSPNTACMSLYIAYLAEIESQLKKGSLNLQNYTLLNFTDWIQQTQPPCATACLGTLNPGETPIVEPVGWNTDCVTELQGIAGNNAQTQYDQYISGLISTFRNAYIAKCLQAKENLNTRYTADRYHYTLYYYDQAGNLVKTVPPNGVKTFTATADLADIVSKRNLAAATPTVTRKPAHAMSTVYTFNSLNQTTEQRLPDHYKYTKGIFYYDRLGRLVLSQNAEQLHAKIGSPTNFQYSYTKYDYLGRINEVGELTATTNTFPAGMIASHQVKNEWTYNGWLNPKPKQQVTNTTYDYATLTATDFQLSTLRGRVTRTALDVNGDGLPENTSHYSYDVHGNVRSMINEYKYALFENIPNKRIDYEYDLVSGKVNAVYYQKDQTDQFRHRYYYDADNRLIEVQTSNEGYVWNKDAKYYYNLHGPLARVELGDKKVQGLDYYYTIHGWIKGINSEIGSRVQDPGRDGYTEVAGNPQGYFSHTKNIHNRVGLDAFAYNIGYYEASGTAKKDYVPIRNVSGGVAVPGYVQASDPYADPTLATSFSSNAPNLYNGNIKHLAASIVTATYASNYLRHLEPMLQAFKYDQLNRIKSSSAYHAFYDAASFAAIPMGTPGNASYNKWNTAQANQVDHTFTTYSYDYNGNITDLKRDRFNPTSYAYASMDQLSYTYVQDNAFSSPTVATFKNTNKLDYVKDNITTSSLPAEFKTGQAIGNYDYDEIGNLTKDVQEQIAQIDWNVYGKIEKITHQTGSLSPDLEFRYDSKGNRIVKIVKPRTSLGPRPQNFWTLSYYVRDAQGNVMSVQENTYTNVAGTQYTKSTKLKETHLFGSARLGLFDRSSENITAVQTFTASSNNFYAATVTYGSSSSTGNAANTAGRKLGTRQYELSNHLGNVQTVVSDKKLYVAPATYTLNNSFATTVEGWASCANSTVSAVSGRLKVQTAALANNCITHTLTTTAGQTYHIRLIYDPVTSPLTVTVSIPGLMSYTLTPGLNELDYVATTSGTQMLIGPTAPVIGIYYLDNISVTNNEEYYLADVLNTSDYYAFGQVLPGRSYTGTGYRYGFNGKEKDNEVYGEGNVYDYGARIYDPRIGRFLSIDPLLHLYRSYSPYHFALNSPIFLLDIDGRIIVDSKGNVVTITENNGVVTFNSDIAPDTKEALLAMTGSETGKEQLRKMNSSASQIKVVVSDEVGVFQDINGEYFVAEAYTVAEGIGKVKGTKLPRKQTLTIYKGSRNIQSLNDLADDVKYNVRDLYGTVISQVKGEKIKKGYSNKSSSQATTNSAKSELTAQEIADLKEIDKRKSNSEAEFLEYNGVHESVHTEEDNYNIAEKKGNTETPAYRKEIQLYHEKKKGE